MTIANAIDFYKADHRSQAPEGTEVVFSNWTARASRIPDVDHVVFFGLQYYLREYLKRRWDDEFFSQDRETVVSEYHRRMTRAGLDIDVQHMRDLHDLGYLPIKIMALPEGTRVPIGVPMFVIWNTDTNFAWLTNYLESSMSAIIWGPCTSATIAHRFRSQLDEYLKLTGGDLDFAGWQGHDFSYRGMFGNEAAALSGAGHLLSFTGTDTVPAIDFLEKFYFCRADTEVIGGSVPATEHSVMCLGTDEGEADTFRRLITEVYPEGVISIVSDTWDYWSVWTDILPGLKDEILARAGCVTIRPDSGDPVKIICGDPTAPEGSPQHKGSFQLAWDLFGGTVNAKGFKQLDPHINLIYGDSITFERFTTICRELVSDGFVPSMVFGIGSYTYQYNTRDTFGFAMKATAGIVNGELRAIFKDPKTDDGTKKSARGLLAVYRNSQGNLTLHEGVSWHDVHDCEFNTVFLNGTFPTINTLGTARAHIRE